MGDRGRTLEQEAGCRRSGLGNVTVLAALNRADPCLSPEGPGEDQPPDLSGLHLSFWASLVTVGTVGCGRGPTKCTVLRSILYGGQTIACQLQGLCTKYGSLAPPHHLALANLATARSPLTKGRGTAHHPQPTHTRSQQSIKQSVS